MRSLILEVLIGSEGNKVMIIRTEIECLRTFSSLAYIILITIVSSCVYTNQFNTGSDNYVKFKITSKTNT